MFIVDKDLEEEKNAARLQISNQVDEIVYLEAYQYLSEILNFF